MSISRRTVSTFENGYGDEGVVARLIYGLCMAIIVLVSGIIGVIILPFWAIRKLRGKNNKGNDGRLTDNTQIT